ncbi:MAG: MFS transporter [Rhizobiaceae bacterium MnEN-MB40S]|nr:MAG: MFS transporter [Rhizobiaceae bacterium MnEN-MB40S]
MTKHTPDRGRSSFLNGNAIALALSMLLASLGVSIATVALPALSREFSVSVSDVQWVILAYLLAVTVTVVPAGRMGDLFGHRRVLLIGLAVFAAASALSSVAPTLAVLVIARAVQGIGGAILMALTVSAARELVSVDRTGSLMGLLGSMSAVGTALGPSLGGVLISSFGWRSCFVLMTALGLGALLTAIRGSARTNSPAETANLSLDLPGSLALGLALAFYALAMTGTFSSRISGSLLLTACGLATVLFIVLERRAKSPLVHLPAFRNHTILASLFMNLLVSTGMMATLVIGPFYLIFGLGLNEALVGMTMAVGPVVAAVSGVPAGRLTDRFGPAAILLAGLAEMMVGFICLAFLPGLLGVGGYVLSLAILTPGFQLFLAANNTTMMIAAEANQRGMLSGLLGLSRNLGFMTGASGMSALFAAVVGTRNIQLAASETVSKGFLVVFLAAAGLMIIAMAASRSPFSSPRSP